MKFKYIKGLPTALDCRKPLYMDLETYGENIRLASLYQRGMDFVYVCDVDKMPKRDLRTFFSRFDLTLGYNLKFDYGMLGYTYSTCPNFDDLYLAVKLCLHYLEEHNLGYVLQSVGLPYTLDKKALQKSDWSKPVLTEDQLLYSAYDVYLLPSLEDILTEMMDWRNHKVYQLDLEVSKILLNVERNGLEVNSKVREELMNTYSSQLKTLLAKIPFNINSPKQATAFFKTAKADKEELVRLASEGNEIANLVLEAKKLDKSLAFLEKYSDRVFGHFNVCGAKSGRMTCSSENIQQIPRHLRKVFGFNDERRYVIADYPQIELRLAGVIWHEPEFLEAFRQNRDLHKYTATVIYGKPEEAITKQERQISKSANFGLLYGMGAERFKQYVFTNTQILLDIAEAIQIKNSWLSLFQAVRRMHKNVARRLELAGEFSGTTWLGREYTTNSFTEALNIMIQGSGADLVKKALTLLTHKTQVVNIIHDEIVVETTLDEAKEVQEDLKCAMEDAWKWCQENSVLPVEPLEVLVEDVIVNTSLEKE